MPPVTSAGHWHKAHRSGHGALTYYTSRQPQCCPPVARGIEGRNLEGRNATGDSWGPKGVAGARPGGINDGALAVAVFFFPSVASEPRAPAFVCFSGVSLTAAVGYTGTQLGFLGVQRTLLPVPAAHNHACGSRRKRQIRVTPTFPGQWLASGALAKCAVTAVPLAQEFRCYSGASGLHFPLPLAPTPRWQPTDFFRHFGVITSTIC